LFEIFIEHFGSVVNKHAPLKELRRTETKFRSKPWLTKGIRNSIKTKKHYIKFTRKLSAIQNVQKQFNSCEEKSKKLYYNNLFETNKAIAKKVWQVINDLLRRKKNRTFSLTKIIATDGRIITDGGVDGQTHKTTHFHPRHRHPPTRNDPPKRRAWVRLNRLRTGVGRFRSCLYKRGMASSAPVRVAQKNKPSTMLSSNDQSIDLPMDCRA